MKDKKWLKEQLSYLQDGVGESFNDYSKGLNSAYNTLELLIDQLEEPEQEKVVVPDFIAEYIESLKYRGLNFYSGYRHAERCADNGKNNIQEWLDSEENLETFARAWLDGYSVEKEKLYKVELPIDRIYYILTVHGDNSGHFFGKEHVNDSWYRTYLTEQEIKAIDERFWAFREEVEAQ